MPPEKSAVAHDNNNVLNESASPSDTQIDEESAQILSIEDKLSPETKESSPSPKRKVVINSLSSLSQAQKRIPSCEMGTVFGPNDSRLEAESFQCVVSYIWKKDYDNSSRSYQQLLNARFMKTEADWDWLNRRIPKRGHDNCREDTICSINYYFYPKDVELVFPHGVN